MRLIFKQFWAITRLSALEAVRQPITLLVTLGVMFLIGLLPILVTHTLGESLRLVRDSALSLHLLTGLVLGAFLACAALSQDIRKGTATAVLSKPVQRPLFLVAKFAGVATAILCFSLLIAIATLLAARTAREEFMPDWWGIGPLFAAIFLALAIAGVHHYFARGAYSSRAYGYLLVFAVVAAGISGSVPHLTSSGEPAGGLLWSSVPVSALITMATLVLTAFAVSLATRLELIPVLTICLFVLAAGLISDYAVGQLSAAPPLLRRAIEVIPNWQNFWAVDALNHDGIPPRYLARVAMYSALYLAGILAAGIFAFRRMEVR